MTRHINELLENTEKAATINLYFHRRKARALRDKSE
jgi:hypothetical protein